MAHSQDLSRLLFGDSIDAKCAVQEGLATKLARLHQKLLPDTPTSRAGFDVIQKMYQLSLDHKDSVLVVDDVGDPKAFILLTANQTQLTRFLLKNIGMISFLKLSFFNLINPGHTLALNAFSRAMDPFKRETSLYILTLGKDASSKILASQLLARAKAYAQQQKYSKIWVDTQMVNKKAVHFYLKNQFSEVAQSFGNVLLSLSLGHKG